MEQAAVSATIPASALLAYAWAFASMWLAATETSAPRIFAIAQTARAPTPTERTARVATSVAYPDGASPVSAWMPSCVPMWIAVTEIPAPKMCAIPSMEVALTRVGQMDPSAKSGETLVCACPGVARVCAKASRAMMATSAPLMCAIRLMDRAQIRPNRTERTVTLANYPENAARGSA